MKLAGFAVTFISCSLAGGFVLAGTGGRTSLQSLQLMLDAEGRIEISCGNPVTSYQPLLVPLGLWGSYPESFPSTMQVVRICLFWDFLPSHQMSQSLRTYELWPWYEWQHLGAVHQPEFKDFPGLQLQGQADTLLVWFLHPFLLSFHLLYV